MFPLLIESSKDAGQLLSNYLGTRRYVSLMNKKATSVGMETTHFVSPHGGGGENTSTLSDLFLLSKYIYNNRSFIVALTSGKKINNAYEQPEFKNLSSLISLNGINGYLGGIQDVSTPLTSGLYFFERTVGNEIRPLVIILNNTKTPEDDVRKILEYLSVFR